MPNLNLKECIRQEFEIHKKLGFHDPLRELLLAFAESFTGQPFRGTPLAKKQCFSNALHYALDNGLSYCEGFGISGDLIKGGFPLPMEHAWACDDDGMVFDPTWTEAGSIYFGIRFDADIAAKRCLQKKTYGVFFDGHGCGLHDKEYIKTLCLKLPA